MAIIDIADINAKIKRDSENRGAPESMRNLDKVEVKDMVGKKFTVDECIIQIKPKMVKDEVTGVYKVKTYLNKRDNEEHDVYKAVVFIAFDKKYYFATTSKDLFKQVEVIRSDEKIPMSADMTVPVDAMKGAQFSIQMIKTRYADGKDYEIPVLVN